jgi:hypothetical protein
MAAGLALLQRSVEERCGMPVAPFWNDSWSNIQGGSVAIEFIEVDDCYEVQATNELKHVAISLLLTCWSLDVPREFQRPYVGVWIF